MDEMPSAQFRKVYAKLTQPTIVTVNGHALGKWEPVHAPKPTIKGAPGGWYSDNDVVDYGLGTPDQQEAAAERILKGDPGPVHVMDSAGYNRPPFTPVPKVKR